MDAQRLKVAGFVLVVIPAAVLLLFAFGETASGDVGGLVHLIPATPLIVLAAVAWRRPLVGGVVLAGVGGLIAAFYPFGVDGSALVVLSIELILFAPFVAGLLFIRAGWAEGDRLDGGWRIGRGRVGGGSGTNQA